MIFIERNALITIAPVYDKNFDPDSKFRWGMHVSLPFPFPAKNCVKETASAGGLEYLFAIHNHLDRAFITPKSQPAMPRVTLIDRNKPLPRHEDYHLNIEHLQSVAIYQENKEFRSPNDAFSDASKKIQSCFDHLSAYLAKRQIEAPYLASWLVYPISLFDVGTVYHTIERMCNEHKEWQSWATAPAISIAKRLQHPVFFLDAEELSKGDVASHPVMESVNELLAEALMSLFRGLVRLSVVNSYSAVESLANVVFTKAKTGLLASKNVPQDLAEELVEEQRQRHKTEPSFLFHRGIKDVCGRSLYDEHKDKYDALLALQGLRHKVAHAGHKPTQEEARNGHKLACECVQWLAEVGGFPVKPLLPSQASQVPGFSMAATDINAINAGEFEFLRYALGFNNEPPCEDKAILKE